MRRHDHGSLRRALPALGVAAALALAGCNANPPLGPATGHDEGGLEVALTVTPDHVHILQTEATFTVEVTDHDGAPVHDFESLAVERRMEGSDDWREVEVALSGEHYTGVHTFVSSGEYELRVVGQRPGEAESTVLHEVAEHLHVARAHAEVDGIRVEFETFPGHIHEGETATLRFWAMEPEADASGQRPPVTGLDARGHVAQPDGTEAMYEAHEHEPGEYETEHLFGAPGETHAGFHFTSPDGHAVEAEWHLHVSHGH